MPTNGFLSVFDQPTPSEAQTPNWSNWADQSDPFGVRYDTVNQIGNPLYDYGNVGYGSDASYDPVMTGDPYGAYSTEYGSNIITSNLDEYNRKAHPELYSGYGDYGTQTNPGIVTNLGGDWAKVDSWNSQITAAVQSVYTKTGVYVPPNFVKAIMKLESGGNNVNDPGGAVGLMQVMPGIWGDQALKDWGANIYTPEGNILAGVNILAQNYNQGSPTDGTKSWEWAAKRYLGLTGADSYGTTADTYWNTVSANWNQLQSGAATTSTQGGQTAPNTTKLSAIWGGIDAPITQGFGMTDFAKSVLASGGGSSEYDYTKEYSPTNTRSATTLMMSASPTAHAYAPAAGTIEIIGSADGQSWFYTSQDPNGQDIHNPRGGELAIKEANGDVYILGHMSDIIGPNGVPYKVGDTVAPLQFVGYSGTSNGAHVHVEYRKWTPGATSSGYTAIPPDDPQAFGGGISGQYSASGGSGPTAATDPATNWNNFMIAAAKGQPLTGTIPSSGGGGFHDWLLGKMPGHAPTISDPGSTNPIWLWAGGGQGANTSTQTKTG